MAIPGYQRQILERACGLPIPRILSALDMADLADDSQFTDYVTPLLAALVPAVAGPDLVQFMEDGDSSTGVFAYAFDKTTEEQVYLTVQLPHGYKLGSTIYPHIHWSPMVNGGSGTKVSWGLEYTWQDLGSVFPASTIIYGNAHVPSDAVPLAKKSYLTPIGSGISTSGLGISSTLICRLFRDASGAGATDDYDNDAAVMSFDFHYEMDSIGSDEEYVK